MSIENATQCNVRLSVRTSTKKGQFRLACKLIEIRIYRERGMSSECKKDPKQNAKGLIFVKRSLYANSLII